MSENVWGSCQRNGADPYVFYLLLFKKIEMSYKNRPIRIKISHAPLATKVAREEGLHERSSYLISPDDLPPSEGEGALPENGMRHIDNKKTPVDCEQAPDDYHYKISNAPLAANAARGMACAIYKTKKYLLIVSKLPSGDIF